MIQQRNPLLPLSLQNLKKEKKKAEFSDNQFWDAWLLQVIGALDFIKISGEVDWGMSMTGCKGQCTLVFMKKNWQNLVVDMANKGDRRKSQER